VGSITIKCYSAIGAKKYKNCFEGSCKEYDSKDQLLKDIIEGEINIFPLVRRSFKRRLDYYLLIFLFSAFNNRFKR